MHVLYRYSTRLVHCKCVCYTISYTVFRLLCMCGYVARRENERATIIRNRRKSTASHTSSQHFGCMCVHVRAYVFVRLRERTFEDDFNRLVEFVLLKELDTGSAFVMEIKKVQFARKCAQKLWEIITALHLDSHWNSKYWNTMCLEILTLNSMRLLRCLKPRRKRKQIDCVVEPIPVQFKTLNWISLMWLVFSFVYQ